MGPRKNPNAASNKKLASQVAQLTNMVQAAKVNKPSVPRPVVAPMARPGLSHCAQKYALAIADPWAPEAQGACIPRHPSRPSQKITVFSRFQLSVGGSASSGTYGAIFVCPSMANDAPTLFYLDNVAELASLPTSAADVQKLLPFMKQVLPNSPYPTSAFQQTLGGGSGAAVQGRIVSCGLSCQYMGSALNQGGVYTMYTNPNHDNMMGYAPTAYSGYDETLIDRIGEKKQWMIASGIDDSELSYSLFANNTAGTDFLTTCVYPFSNSQTITSENTPGTNLVQWIGLVNAAAAAGATTVVVKSVSGSPPASGTFAVLQPVTNGVPGVVVVTYSAFTNSGSVYTFTVTALSAALVADQKVSSAPGYTSGTLGCIPGGAPMVFLIQPAIATSTNIYEVEYVQHLELTGPLTSALHTPTHSDSVGFEVVQNAASRLPAARVQSPSTPILTLMGREIKQVLMEQAPAVARAATQMGLSYLGGRLGGIISSGAKVTLGKM